MAIFQEGRGNLAPREVCKILLEHLLTKAGNAESFKTLFESELWWVSGVGKWFRWDAVRWMVDSESAQLAMLMTVRIKVRVGIFLQEDIKRGISVPASLQ